MNSIEVGRAIRSARISRGISVKNAAASAGIGQSWWRQVELGYESKGGQKAELTVRPETLARMCQVVGLPATDILAQAGHPQVAVGTGGAGSAVSELNTTGLDRDDIVRVQAFIDGLKAGKAT